MAIRNMATINFNGSKRTVGILKRQHDHPRINTFAEIYPMLDAINTEHGIKVKLIPPDLAEHITTVDAGSLSDVLWTASPFPVNLVIAYEIPGKPFYNEVVFKHGYYSRLDGAFVRMILSVPSDYRGETNLALVIKGFSVADFKWDGRDCVIVIPENEVGDRVLAIKEFPPLDGRYLPDPEHPKIVIPRGNVVAVGTPGTRFLEREKMIEGYGSFPGDPGSYVGAVFRSVGYDTDGLVICGLVHRISDRVGILIEVPPEDIKKLEQVKLD
ncbi:hypothetical protein HY570_00500 [Candidatus Micrarchaeota archaeon]|nr:hypothetical protein [Candidatus Micrarchaeota archaeon]